MWMDACDPTVTWYVSNNVDGSFGSMNQQTTAHFGKGLFYVDPFVMVLNDNVASNGFGTAAFRDGHTEALKSDGWVGGDSVAAVLYSNNPSYNTK